MGVGWASDGRRMGVGWASDELHTATPLASEITTHRMNLFSETNSFSVKQAATSTPHSKANASRRGSNELEPEWPWSETDRQTSMIINKCNIC